MSWEDKAVGDMLTEKIEEDEDAESWDDVEAGGGGNPGPLPPGEYEATIEEVNKKDTSAGGAGLNLQFNVEAPKKYEGRKFFEFINVEHPDSQEAEDIGKSQIKSMMEASGEPNFMPDTTDDFLDRRMFCRLKVSSWTGDDGEERFNNSITSFKEPSGKPGGPYKKEGERSDLYKKAVKKARGQSDSDGSESDVSDSFDDDDIPF